MPEYNAAPPAILLPLQKKYLYHLLLCLKAFHCLKVFHLLRPLQRRPVAGAATLPLGAAAAIAAAAVGLATAALVHLHIRKRPRQL